MIRLGLPQSAQRDAQDKSSTKGARRWAMPALAAASLAAVAVAGCTTTGMGTGQSPNGKVNAAFSWKSQGGNGGTMTATVGDQVYQGQFFQVTRDTNFDSLGPLWTGWGGRGGWRGWGDWGPDEGFSTEYTGKVLANLQGATGHMRCRFTLREPDEGMSGGGLGHCQLADGSIIDAQFPRG